MTKFPSASGASPVSPPLEANVVDFYTDRARKLLLQKQKHIIDPVITIPNIPPTPEQLDLEERLDKMALISSQALQDAQDVLAERRAGSNEHEPTPSEEAEMKNASAWTRSYEEIMNANKFGNEGNMATSEVILQDLDRIDIDTFRIFASDIENELHSSNDREIVKSPRVQYWLNGSWNFREYRDADFEAERLSRYQIFHGAPRTPKSHSKSASEPPIFAFSRDDYETDEEQRTSPLVPGLKRIYNAAHQSLKRASPSRRSPAWQSVFNIDTKLGLG